eukprot:TRINITY_DN50804_c0_g1_i1.p1 TRINITY_DN50804_c0_g1~~TRINITY_DN50804_c0_g1_i1.p1  ORF type:complete len:111 (+),score=20.44 TRINITY_DN50804_c0_g1_i1:84-416(+)
MASYTYVSTASSSFVPYGSSRTSSKAPMGYSAAQSAKRYEEEVASTTTVRSGMEKVADRAGAEAAGDPSTKGGAKLPFMIDHLYLYPAKIGSGAGYTQTRLQPQGAERPW